MKKIILPQNTKHLTLVGPSCKPEEIILNACRGNYRINPKNKKTFAPFTYLGGDIKKLISSKDFKFENSKKEKVVIYKYDRLEGTLWDMFNSLNVPLEKLYFSHKQILDFFEKYNKDCHSRFRFYELREAIATLFLHKDKKGEVFIAYTFFFNKKLHWGTYDKNYCEKIPTTTDPKGQHRIVVPQSAFA